MYEKGMSMYVCIKHKISCNGLLGSKLDTGQETMKKTHL